MKAVMQFFNNLSIRRKLILSYLLVSIVPISILGCFCYVQTSHLLLEREKSNLEESIGQVSSSLGNQVEIYNNLANYITFNQTITQVISYNYQSYYDMYDKFTTLLDPMLASLKFFHEDIQRVTIYTRNHDVEHGDTIAPLESVQEEAWCKQAVANPGNQWFVSPQDTAFLARQFPTADNCLPLGVLYVELDYDYLFAPFDNLASANCGVFVTDSQQKVIYSSDTLEEAYASYALTPNEFFDEEYQEKLQEDYTVVQETIDSCGWNLYLYKPVDLITKSVNQIAITVGAMILLCLVILLGMGYLLSYVLVYRLEKLTDNVKQIQEGNLELQITDSTEDEIGELIRSFGAMVERMNVLINEVYQGQIRQKEYEMKALQAQINPHFLYNSLSLINWKALQANQPEISRMSLLLSAFYRTALNKGKNMISVRDELKNVESYLEIQLIMHDYGFDVQKEIDPAILDCTMPNLLLQPIVENAIGHGLDLKQNGRGELRITGRLQDGNLHFEIADNGVGMDEETLAGLLTHHTGGYGFHNVNERIQLTYGRAWPLRVESVAGEGTCVIMEFPSVPPESEEAADDKENE